MTKYEGITKEYLKEFNMHFISPRSRQFSIGLVGLSLTTLFTACSTVTPPQTATNSQQTTTARIKPWKDREMQLSQLHNWHLSGKIAVRTARDSGSASVDWSQVHDQYSVTMSGPLGAHSMKLYGHPGAVTLITSDGKQYTAKNADQLLAERWGFHLPVTDLRYWIRGIPVPGMAYRNQLDQYNRLATLSQGGFTIQYLNYTSANGIDLPGKIDILSPALKTKIIIYNWKIS